MRFNNKNVIITGASEGIGFSTAKAFIQEGATVWITGRNKAKLENAALEISNSRLKTIVSDTAILEDIDYLSREVEQANFEIDVLFMNAGTGLFSTIENTSEVDFDLQFKTNVKGSFFTLQKLMPYLKNGATVIFTSSTAATASIIESSVYAATKASINKIAKIASNELADRNIRVNIVSPGPIATSGFEKDVAEEAKKALASGIALKRMGLPDEVAKTVLFLSSEEAGFINGTEILVDGGFINYSLK